MTAAQRIATAADAAWAIKLEEPLTRLMTGLPVTHIPVGSPDEAASEAARAAALLAGLQGMDEVGLSETDRLTLDFLRHDLGQVQQATAAWQHASPVTPYASMGITYLAQQLLAPMAIDSMAALDRWSGLWTDMAAAVRGVRARVLAQAAQGRRLARPAIEPTLATWDHIRLQLGALLTPSTATAAIVDADLVPCWTAVAERLRDQEVLPAVQGVIELLRDPGYRNAAPDAVGLMHQPGGPAEYQRLLVTHLTLPHDPQRIHDTGVDEVSRLAERMREVRSRLGFNGSESEFHAALKVNPRVIAQSADEVAQRYMACMQRLEPLLPNWFARMPRSPYGVERLAPEQEAGMTYGYFDKPRTVGERGVYRFNASDLENRSQLQVPALIYHELAPGHHFHIARQMELDHLPALRRNAMALSVFNEGWAEYASGLAEEMGLYDDPYDLYGRLVHERFVAQRLVVDTGMNALGWTLDEARNFMRDNTLEGEAQIASETLRYSTDLPAQALAYRLGYLWFMQLREDTKARRGAAFDIREFHEAVLGEGALPLAAVRGHVERLMP